MQLSTFAHTFEGLKSTTHSLPMVQQTENGFYYDVDLGDTKVNDRTISQLSKLR